MIKKVSTPLLLVLLSFIPFNGYAQLFDYEGLRYGVIDVENNYVELQKGDYSDFEEINIPSTVYYNNEAYTVTRIGYSALSGFSHLKKVVLPNTISYICNGAFVLCPELTSISFPNSVEHIDNAAFYGCKSLTSIIIPNSVRYLGSEVFSYCTGLKSVIIGNSVKELYGTFSYCI